MTLPKQVLPNTTYLVTRRCTQRLFLLKPSPLNTQIFTYCLSVAAKKMGMLVHAVVVLSNHYHVVLDYATRHNPGVGIISASGTFG